jgi:DNA (cytosine-5)-methyltransferase 1
VSVYYNEHDPFAAAWLRELMKAGEIPDGVVDTRDIQDVAAADVGAFTQCHFFAGIGGWALALQLAGWGNRPVWTGSCPCQPFSNAGHRKGGTDSRHLWPHWQRLIAECRPVTVVGEQVESAIRHGWLDAVFDDLEAQGYACGAIGLPAASAGALFARHRLWFVATTSDAHRSRWEGERTQKTGTWDQQQFERLVQDQLQSALPTGRLRALSDGISGRMGRLRGYGNAIVPQVAAEVLRAYLEVMP